MNKRNKAKLKEVLKAEYDVKFLNYFLETISFKAKIRLSLNVTFRTRRGCLFLSCISRGMSISSAYGYAFKSVYMTEVVRMLDEHGWDISFGKID